MLSTLLQGKMLRATSVWALRMMQSAPFVHWFEGEEEFKQLARVFYLHPCACARGSPARPGPGPAALGGARSDHGSEVGSSGPIDTPSI